MKLVIVIDEESLKLVAAEHVDNAESLREALAARADFLATYYPVNDDGTVLASRGYTYTASTDAVGLGLMAIRALQRK